MSQDEALTILKTGANVFLTGEPGSGKTHTINEYVHYLRSHSIEPAITASTGIAATHIGGQTIHSWSGIGVRSTLSDYDIDKISQNERLVRRVKHASVLIIDEISMLPGRTLSMVEMVCRTLRGNDQVFGGLQVVLVGDFFQLPPITKEEHGQNTDFAYTASTWSALNPIVCYLEEQHRQEDTELLGILSAIRSGRVGETHRELLVSRSYRGSDLENVTKLFSHNADVDRVNNDALARVETPAKHFHMQSHGAPALATRLRETCLSPAELVLKIGARVMFTKNDPQGTYVNGTTGTVVDFRSDSYPIVETTGGKHISAEPAEWRVESDGRVLASVTQVPLRLAWAITVHKSQGVSLDAALIDLSRAFEYGQGYVALSRVRSLSGLYLLGINERALEIHPQIKAFDEKLKLASEKANEIFGTMDEAAQKILHTNFLRACGGNIEARTHTDVRKTAVKPDTLEETLALLSEHSTLQDIAKARSLTIGTILMHLEKLKTLGKLPKDAVAPLLSHLTPVAIQEIEGILRNSKDQKLRPAYDALKEKYSFEDIRLVRLTL